MEKIKVDKQKLISVLKENKIKHIEDYEKAIVGYKIQAEKLLKSKLKELKELAETTLGNFNINAFTLYVPESHEDDFNTVLGMLEVSKEDEVYITTEEYRQYYLNEWSWKQNWYFSNSENIGVACSTPSSMFYVDGKK